MMQGEARRSFRITQKLVSLRPNGTDLSQILRAVQGKDASHVITINERYRCVGMTSALSLHLPSVYFRIRNTMCPLTIHCLESNILKQMNETEGRF